MRDASYFPEDQLAFDVVFLEGVLENDPCNAEALVYLGHAYTHLGRYEDGLRMDRRIVRMFPDDPTSFYNLACSYSLLNRIDEAIEALRQAEDRGYSDWLYMLKDPDLDNLQNDPRFAAIVRRIQGK
ncbi:MAG: tetratricopeptide repeat protein [Planctomycetes bacterium]|nr:tetratricopeptide repeat protein [Planctomycetota bacterium]